MEQGRLCARKGYLKEAGLGLGLEESTAANQTGLRSASQAERLKGKGQKWALGEMQVWLWWQVGVGGSSFIKYPDC